MEPLGPLRADAIFADLSRELDNNCETFSKKVREIARSAAVKNIVTPTAASNALEKLASK